MPCGRACAGFVPQVLAETGGSTKAVAFDQIDKVSHPCSGPCFVHCAVMACCGHKLGVPALRTCCLQAPEEKARGITINASHGALCHLPCLEHILVGRLALT